MADVSILKSGQSRIWIQEAASPAEPYKYYGCVSLTNPTQNQGAPEPIYCPSPDVREAWDIVDEIKRAPELGTTDFTQKADRGMKDVWWSLRRKGCLFNIQVLNGACQKPDDFTDWDSKILLGGVRLTNFSLGALNALAGADNADVPLNGSLTFRKIDRILSLAFGEVADTTTLAEILDGIYRDVITCGECGPASDGCKKSFWLQAANSGSPGLSGQIVYTVDGSNYLAIDIPTLGGLSGNRLGAMGSYLVVVSEATRSHHYSLFSNIEAGVVAWTQNGVGYVAGKGPRAIYVKSATQAWLAGAGGYIYYMSNPTSAVQVIADGSATVQNMNQIRGFGNVIVAVGDNNAILRSTNGGLSFGLITGPAVGVSLSSVWLLSESIWFVTTGNGRVYYTLNKGGSWTLVLQTGTVINDIRFADGNVGYLVAEVGGVGRVYRTTDGGNTWNDFAPHISNWSTAVRFNCVVPCNLNKVGVGGRKTVGGDGVISVAEG